MNILFQYISYSIFIGVGATIFMDLYALFIKRVFKIPSLDFALVGRWVGHFKHGVFVHKNIMQAEKITGERALGWTAHYLIGISFAFILLLTCGLDWLQQPTLFVCIIVGIATTAAPWFMMQPAFGFGIAASKTPKPVTARLRSLQAHAIYGLGLYSTALLLNKFIL